ncbi:MAG TPA: PQQ-binding-like beta-propeller repeat protein [Gemmataceae bacterium]|nr:PQQ-binding-like beta-propeller repeat protein [Gemmataceae bacterium]
MQIDPSLRGKMPQVAPPIPFQTSAGAARGWRVAIPGGRPLATPAVVGGLVFLGGGFGSYDIYALDAATGRLAWQYQTTDDGPTAAVVCEGHVVFNTESCELEVLTAEGRPVWKRWLGDPLMSMPAVGGGRVYAAYPDSRGDRRHYLAAFDLSTGREVWRQPLSGEVITAPVLAGGRVYAATLDGTLYCFGQDGGTPIWQEAKNATAAPVVWNDRCYFSQRREVPPEESRGGTPQQTEHVAARGTEVDAETSLFNCTMTPAAYLDYARRRRRSPHDLACELADGAVGFAASKGDAKMAQAMFNLGKGHVSAVWAHQGSRPCLWRGRLYGALGDALHCADPDTRAPYWKHSFPGHEGQAELLDGLLTPPAIVNGKVFLGTLDGEVCCLSAWSGDLLWSAWVGEPVLFQPAVARGRVYATTQTGSLFCLETGDPGDDGWLMWGAGPDHNGLPG